MKKWMYDFLLSVCMLALITAALVYSYFLESPRITLFLARPDTYMAMWLILLAVLAFMLMARALKARKTQAGQQQGAAIWSRTGLLTTAILFVYLLILKPLGFLLDSVLMLWSLSALYTVQSYHSKRNYRDRKVLLPMLLRTGIFSLIASYATFWVFTSALSSKLPTFSLF
jgi:hypothetical protein